MLGYSSCNFVTLFFDVEIERLIVVGKEFAFIGRVGDVE